MVGTLGACHKRRDTTIGDTVNVASRIEGANKEAGTHPLISNAMLERVRDRVRIGCQVELALKGKSGTHQLHEILSVE